MSPVVRNVLIVVGIAAVISLSSTASAGAVVLRSLLGFLILAGMLYFGYVLWRENRSRLSYLSASRRALLIGAAAIAVIAVITSPLWVTGFAAAIGFFALLGVCGYAIYRVVDEARGYY